MNFALVIIVLLNYFIRLQDWVPGMAGLNVMNVLMALTLLATVTRPEGFNLRTLVATPIDWAMLAYLGYIVLSAPAGDKPFSHAAIFFAYYAVTSLALTTPTRLNRFLLYWLIAVGVIALMAIASEYGMDLTGAKKLTHAKPDDPRLVLNTYLFNNPNALGHTVATLIPLAYLLLFWKKPLSRRLIAVVAITVAVFCVYLTRSKGAYLVCFVLIVLSVLLGRSIFFQLLALLLALTIGIQVIQQLPRMTDLDGMRRDEGVMGRVLAWDLAREVSKRHPAGKGFDKHESHIEWEGQTIEKATHGSYVLIAAELGSRGMFFYLAVLYACLRSLGTSRRDDIADESSRKALFALLAGFMASGWMIDRSYHLEYFLLAGASSAYYRRIRSEAPLATALEEEQESPSPVPEPTPPGDSRILRKRIAHQDPQPAPYELVSSSPGHLTFEQPEGANEAERTTAAGGRLIRWRRWGIIDFLLVLLMCKVVFGVWDHILNLFLY